MSDSTPECTPSLLPRYQQDLTSGGRFDSIAAAEISGDELSEKGINSNTDPDNDPNTCNAEHKHMINDKLTSIPPQHIQVERICRIYFATSFAVLIPTNLFRLISVDRSWIRFATLMVGIPWTCSALLYATFMIVTEPSSGLVTCPVYLANLYNTTLKANRAFFVLILLLQFALAVTLFKEVLS